MRDSFEHRLILAAYWEHCIGIRFSCCLSGNIGGLCTLIGREKPGGREKVNRGKKERKEEEEEEEKEKRKRKVRETKKEEDASGQYGCAFVKR
jgi:hypothetical protein